MQGFGWSFEGVGLDWARLVVAKNSELVRQEVDTVRRLGIAGVTLLPGRGRLIGAHTVEIDGKSHTAAHVVVATGSRPALPDVPGIAYAVTSDHALDLMQLPGRMTIIGGGAVGVEFASMFNAFGVRVTVVVRGDGVLRGCDVDLRATLTEAMIRRGITVRCDAVVEAIDKIPGGYVVRLAGGDTVETDLVVAATGRIPNSEDIGLDQAGVQVDRGGAIIVDSFSRTTIASVFAIGDVTARRCLASVAVAEADALVDTLFRSRPTALDPRLIPLALLTFPPAATIGLTEAEARLKGEIDVVVSRPVPLRLTMTTRDEPAMVKLVVDKASDRVLGLHMVGADAPEILQGFAVALKCGATRAQIAAALGIYTNGRNV
jgi:glutathione reductase (NADPH)